MRIASVGVLTWVLCAFVCYASAAEGGETKRSDTAGKDAEAPKSKPRLTDSAIKKILIAESIANYDGNCPCPYNTASNGSRCGRRSAYSRAGGEGPLCYDKDVSPTMVEEYRKAHPDEP